MQFEDLDYKPSWKPLSEYTVIKLERGTPTCHLDFVAKNHYGSTTKARGWKKEIDPQEEHAKKEAKLLKAEVKEEQ